MIGNGWLIKKFNRFSLEDEYKRLIAMVHPKLSNRVNDMLIEELKSFPELSHLNTGDVIELLVVSDYAESARSGDDECFQRIRKRDLLMFAEQYKFI